MLKQGHAELQQRVMPSTTAQPPCILFNGHIDRVRWASDGTFGAIIPQGILRVSEWRQCLYGLSLSSTSILCLFEQRVFSLAPFWLLRRRCAPTRYVPGNLVKKERGK